MILGSNQIFINNELLVWSIIITENPVGMDYQWLDLVHRVMTGLSRIFKMCIMN
jgi:hypothetical protein